jgi:hypothetical protein
MTLKITWLHEAENSGPRWIHEGEDSQVRENHPNAREPRARRASERVAKVSLTAAACHVTPRSE